MSGWDRQPGGWFDEALDRQMAKVRETGYQPPKRYVSGKVYAEAQRAVDAGATPRQVELVLAGMSWEDAKKCE